MNLLMVEDHELFREGLKLLLTGLHEPLVFLEAASICTAESLLEQHAVSLILMDYHLRSEGGEQCLLRLKAKAPQAMVVVVSGEENPAKIIQLIELGAAGYIPKKSSQAVMMAALKLVMAGGVYLPECLLRAAHSVVPIKDTTGFSRLSGRQHEIIRQAILGKPNKMIAGDLQIAEATVKAHLSGAYRLLGVKNRTEAVFAAAQDAQAVSNGGPTRT